MPVRANLDLDSHRRAHETADYLLDWRARIWSYDPTACELRQVHVSPTAMGKRGFHVARQYGFSAIDEFIRWYRSKNRASGTTGAEHAPRQRPGSAEYHNTEADYEHHEGATGG